ncbi:MAG: S8 family serine peptidase [bacterium]
MLIWISRIGISIPFIALLTFASATQNRPTELCKLDSSATKADNYVKSDWLSVYFVLNAQADFQAWYPSVKTLPKGIRRDFMRAKLQDLAEAAQQYLLMDLMDQQTQGYARNIRALWLCNAVAVEIQTESMTSLVNRHPEVAYWRENAPRDFFASMNIIRSKDSAAGCDELGWGLEEIQAPQVWSLGFRGQDVLIAIIDSGVDYNHPDLADRIWVNPGEDLNGNGVVDSSDWNGQDDDQNGYVDDLRGWAFDLNSANVMDSVGHGTCVAGIVAGDGSGGNNTGVAPEAKIMILRNYSGSEFAFCEAVQYAIEKGADIITSSLGYKWYFEPKPDYATLRQCAETELLAGIIHSNTIGNEGDNLSMAPIPFNIAAPGNCPPPWLHPDQVLTGGLSAVLGVAGYDSSHVLLFDASIGPSAWNLTDILSLDPTYPWAANWPMAYNDYPYANAQYQALIKPDLAAPSGVLSTNRGGGYVTTFGGASAAVPHVAGTLALLLSAYPEAAPEMLARILMTTAVDMGIPGKDNNWGCGRINAYEATMALLLETSAILTGVVTNSLTGEPVSQAEVDLPNLQLWTQTDSSGNYFLSGITPGTYDVRFSAAAYDTLIVPDFSLSVGEIETLYVALISPQISVTPQEITAVLDEGDELQIPLLVHNSGGSDLIVQFSKQGDWLLYEDYLTLPVQAVTGDDKMFGVEVAEGSFWISGGNSNQEPNLLYRFSFSGELDTVYQQPPSTSFWGWRDLAWDGSYLYGSSGEVIEEVDLNGNLQSSFPGPLSLHRALAYDPQSDHFFAADNTSNLLEFGRDGVVVQTWSHDLHIQGLAWHPQDSDSCFLYIFSQDGSGALLRLSKMNPATGEIVHLTDLDGATGDQAGGATITAELDPDRWCLVGLVQAPSDYLKVISLDVCAAWFNIEPLSETIPPGGTLEAVVLLDASAVTAGEYHINLVVQHNAPSDSIVIPVSLQVQPSGSSADEKTSALLPDGAILKIYPNPGNAQAGLHLELAAPTWVIIRLYNLAGQKITDVFSGLLVAGENRTFFDVGQLPSGVYFIRAFSRSSGGEQNLLVQKKVVILK